MCYLPFALVFSGGTMDDGRTVIDFLHLWINVDVDISMLWCVVSCRD